MTRKYDEFCITMDCYEQLLGGLLWDAACYPWEVCTGDFLVVRGDAYFGCALDFPAVILVTSDYMDAYNLASNHDMLQNTYSRSVLSDFEIWQVVAPTESEYYYCYEVRGYVAQVPDDEFQHVSQEMFVRADFVSAKLACEFAYHIFNRPCYRVELREQRSDGDFRTIKVLDSDRRLYRIHTCGLSPLTMYAHNYLRNDCED